MPTALVARELREAIRIGDLTKVTRLLAEDPSRLTMTTPFGTWLHVAASFGQLDIAKCLLESGADVNAQAGIEGAAPLDAAAGEGHLEVVRYLIAHGAALDVSEPHRNPLFAAIYGGHLDVAKALVDAGIDTTVKYTGESMKDIDAAAFAREHGQPAIERMLTERPDGSSGARRVAHSGAGSRQDDVVISVPSTISR